MDLLKKRKPFKDTKVGRFLSDKAPHILDVAGELLPDAGLLGAIGKMIEKSDLSPEEKAQAHVELLKLYELEVEDRKSARFLYSTDSTVQKILATVFTIAYFLLSFVMFKYFIEEEISLGEFEISFISTIFGAMSAKVNTVVDFFFGGSSKKE
tara:strand:- start:1164 stop:1622 length:459 start_codon:yes stop_codon:yes gene_type:complete